MWARPGSAAATRRWPWPHPGETQCAPVARAQRHIVIPVHQLRPTRDGSPYCARWPGSARAAGGTERPSHQREPRQAKSRWAHPGPEVVAARVDQHQPAHPVGAASATSQAICPPNELPPSTHSRTARASSRPRTKRTGSGPMASSAGSGPVSPKPGRSKRDHAPLPRQIPRPAVPGVQAVRGAMQQHDGHRSSRDPVAQVHPHAPCRSRKVEGGGAQRARSSSTKERSGAQLTTTPAPRKNTMPPSSSQRPGATAACSPDALPGGRRRRIGSRRRRAMPRDRPVAAGGPPDELGQRAPLGLASGCWPARIARALQALPRCGHPPARAGRPRPAPRHDRLRARSRRPAPPARRSRSGRSSPAVARDGP